MSENLENIDRFFKGEMTSGETNEFEREINNSEEFAADVAFYLGAVNAIKQQTAYEKKLRFRSLYDQNTDSGEGKIVKLASVRSLWKVAAAAAVFICILAIAFIFLNQQKPTALADNFINVRLTDLPVSMGAGDSIELGKRYINDGKFEEAYRVFNDVLGRNATDPAALEYAGIASLHMGRYDEAEANFRKLTSMNDLMSNPGIFYQAVTLMKRNAAGDLEEARGMLQQVVEQRLGYHEEAKEWLDKW